LKKLKQTVTQKTKKEVMIFPNLNKKTDLMNHHYNKYLRDRSRGLRNTSVSKAEKFLWKNILSRKQLGIGFKRQRPIGNYIVDFFAAEIFMIVEVDGSSHMSKGEYDRIRQDWLEEQGYKVLRFSEGEVLNDFEFVQLQLSHAVHCLKK
jgi:very-short-patch-repair endonuclease